MPEGEWSFVAQKGPRRTISLQISSEAYLLLKLAGAIDGATATGQGIRVIEQWAADLLERDPERLAEVVAEERERRAREHACAGGD